MFKTPLQKLRNALEFTRIYKENSGDVCLREAKCLDFQLEHILVPIDENDGIAGRYEHDYVGFSSQVGGIYTYYYNAFDLRCAINACRAELSSDELYALEALDAFWSAENTARKVEIEFIRRFGFAPGKSFHAPGVGNCDCRVAGTNVDFEKLIQKGLDGLDREIDAAAEANGDSSFYAALKLWIASLRRAAERYRLQAVALLDGGTLSTTARTRVEKMAAALAAIQHTPPSTFLEGVQLMWLYAVSSDLMNYGRMDDYLGGLYAADVDSGRITEEEAVETVLALYKHFKEINKVHDCRVIIGGVGRLRPDAADRLAIVIMEASRRFKETVPQLTLRYFTGMSEAVFQKAMQVNGEGCTFPIIYSDNTNVPAVMQVYGVSEAEAMQYVPFGCGEYVLVGKSVGTPNNGINALKALDLALHGGVDSFHNVRCGANTGALADFDTFEKLYAAVLEQLRAVIEPFAVHKYLNYEIAGKDAPYLHLSLLLDDCIARGKPALSGGVRYLNASSEMFGIISCADSLTAIQQLVYEQHRFTLEQLVEMLDCDFEGFEDAHRLCLDAPKYGNDNDTADVMATRLFSDLGDMTLAAGQKAGLNRYAIVSVNNSMSAEWGNFCSASPCGRHRGAPMANANGASVGADKSGVTALLNSMSKFDNTKHVGVINNVRFTKELFCGASAQVGAVLKTFYENGGVQTNLCVIGRDDLENAMAHPEEYQNLIVRIGGFSARFVTLNPVVQREILERTTYGAG